MKGLCKINVIVSLLRFAAEETGNPPRRSGTERSFACEEKGPKNGRGIEVGLSFSPHLNAQGLFPDFDHGTFIFAAEALGQGHLVESQKTNLCFHQILQRFLLYFD
jgi:hypothetical protein